MKGGFVQHRAARTYGDRLNGAGQSGVKGTSQADEIIGEAFEAYVARSGFPDDG